MTAAPSPPAPAPLTAPHPASPPPAAPAPPRSPPPPRIQLEHTLEHLLQTLLELGICASDVQESALEAAPAGVASGVPGGLVGRKTQQTIDQLARLHQQRDLVADINIPIEVINLVDQGKNPHLHTKNYMERLSGENMYTNGILSAVADYRDLLRSQLGGAFPDLAPYLSAAITTNGPTSGRAAAPGALGEALSPETRAPDPVPAAGDGPPLLAAAGAASPAGMEGVVDGVGLGTMNGSDVNAARMAAGEDVNMADVEAPAPTALEP